VVPKLSAVDYFDFDGFARPRLWPLA